MTDSPDIDAEIIASVREGDREAFESLVDRYRSRVFRLAMRFTGDRAEAEEIQQEVFLTVYQKIDKFEGRSAFSTWIYRVAVNASLMRIRKVGRNETIPIETVDNELSSDEEDRYVPPDGKLITEESLAEIERAMDNMPTDLKTAVILRDVEGFSNEETAEILDLTVPAVKSRLHRAREYLRARLSDLYQNTVEN